MNLIIDVGNSYTKIAVYSKGKLIRRKVTLTKNLIEEVQAILAKYKSIENGIISSVGNLNKSTLTKIQKKIRLIHLNSKTKVPFTNTYKTPSTLGVDRIALVSGCAIQFPDKNVLIIDAGSCITFDFINAKNNYLGGAISPGLQMRYSALNNFTAKLPLLSLKGPRDIVGRTTEQSIHSGVVNGVIKEIDGVIDEYKQQYPDLTVILTGGDTKFLSKRLKNSIFANSNFLLEGLNQILEFNRD